ncbi:MAG: hypothetical protein ABI622_06680 [Chloroflexota bacterium]
MSLPAALTRIDLRLDDEVAPLAALVRVLHAFVGAGCLMAALASGGHDGVALPALLAAIVLFGSALLVPMRREWVRWYVVAAGWLATWVCIYAAWRFPVAPPLANGLLVALLAIGNASLGGFPHPEVRSIAPPLPAIASDPDYDGAIEDL